MAKKRRCYRLMRCIFGEDWDRLPPDWKGRVRWFFGADEKYKKNIYEQIAIYTLASILIFNHFSGHPIDRDMEVFLKWLDGILASMKEWFIGWFQ